MRVLLLTPPMTQVNTPYPATPYLTSFLRKQGFTVAQGDPSLALFLRLFSPKGLAEVERVARAHPAPSPSVAHFLDHAPLYTQTIAGVVAFLQGKDPSLAHRIAGREFLPEGPRFNALKELDRAQGDGLQWAFGALGLRDRALHLASLYIDDLADAVRDGVDPRFELARYGEKLALSAARFDPLLEALQGPPTVVDTLLEQITDELISAHEPTVVGFTVPFPGNLYGALRMAARIRKTHPEVTIVLGGGYPNTELRSLKEPRLFDFVDYVCIDEGGAPLVALLKHLNDSTTKRVRTFHRTNGEVVFDGGEQVIPFSAFPAPTYDGLPLTDYPSLVELLNPMHRLWSDGRWNKMILAHGCYWKKCTFCDVSLDYIGRYEPQTADALVDQIESLIAETGGRGFHFVDEAAPPALLGALADRLIARGVVISWWANIRFEKTFTPELVERLAKSGCVAVSGGLEVASDRLLALMKKGVTVEQVARVTHAFTRAGVLVHAYLMYGFPTQTVQETVDSLERVRQLFLHGCLQSAYWHRFAATLHSPVGKEPDAYGITLDPPSGPFAHNEVPFRDPTGVDHGRFQGGLSRALYNYMHGVGLEEDVRQWFEFSVPRPRVPATLIARSLKS